MQSTKASHTPLVFVFCSFLLWFSLSSKLEGLTVENEYRQLNEGMKLIQQKYAGGEIE